MTPLDLLLYSLVLTPALAIVALLVNLVVNNTRTHQASIDRDARRDAATWR